jgi:phosphoesterase RecJ-like protein
VNPDGDAIGSQLALFHFLKARGKMVEMIAPNNLQEFLKWMDGSDKVHVYTRHREKCNKMIDDADLIVMLDFNKPDRLGEAEKNIMNSGAAKIVIDHHLDPDNFSDILISDPSKCSTAEIIFELVTLINGGQFIDTSFAEAIYAGIITDTGNFEYGAYTGNTLRNVADLLETGIVKERILELVYSNFSADRMRLLGFALDKRMVIIPEFRTAYIYLTIDDLKAYNHVNGDTEGFVNMPLSIRDVTFSALFIEKEGHVKLSFRSKGSFPVNEFAARYFSGGGHLNASGGEYKASLDKTISYFLKMLKEDFKSHDRSN